MKRYVLSAVALLLAGLAVSSANAAKPATPKVELEKDATHIVVGKVQSISPAAQSAFNNYVVEIAIDKIEKGNGLKVGDLVHGRYRWTKRSGIDVRTVGGDGHSPTPNKGDSVRVYLVNKGYNGAGYTTDGGYDVYYNNGFDILTPPR